MTRDVEAIRRSRAENFDAVIDMSTVNPNSPDIRRQRQRYIEHGWKPRTQGTND